MIHSRLDGDGASSGGGQPVVTIPAPYATVQAAAQIMLNNAGGMPQIITGALLPPFTEMYIQLRNSSTSGQIIRYGFGGQPSFGGTRGGMPLYPGEAAEMVDVGIAMTAIPDVNGALLDIQILER